MFSRRSRSKRVHTTSSVAVAHTSSNSTRSRSSATARWSMVYLSSTASRRGRKPFTSPVTNVTRAKCPWQLRYGTTDTASASAPRLRHRAARPRRLRGRGPAAAQQPDRGLQAVAHPAHARLPRALRAGEGAARRRARAHRVGLHRHALAVPVDVQGGRAAEGAVGVRHHHAEREHGRRVRQERAHVRRAHLPVQGPQGEVRELRAAARSSRRMCSR